MTPADLLPAKALRQSEAELRLEQEVNDLCLRYGEAPRYRLLSAKEPPLSPARTPAAADKLVAPPPAMAQLQPDFRKSEAHYRALFESMGQGFCILEAIEGTGGALLDFLHIEANPAFEAQTGRVAIVGKTLRQVLPAEFKERLLIYQNILHTGESIWFEHASGTEGRVLLLYAFRIEDRTQRRIAVSVQDITERKRSEQLLRQNHDTFSQLIDKAPFGLFVIDAQFRLRQVSKASQKVFSGIEPLMGRNFEEVLRLICAEPFASEALQCFRHTLQSGESYATPNTTEQRQNILAVESYDWKIERISLPDGQFGVVCYFYDITERIQAREALRQRTAQFETLVNEAPLGVYLIDADFRVRQVNPAALPVFGDIPGLIGRDFAEVMHILWPAAQADETIQQFRHTQETGEPCHVAEMIEQRSDRQTTEYYEWQINRIPLPDGRHGVVCYFRDISERVLAQQKIRESEERYRSLFNSIDEGFAILDIIFDDEGNAVDFACLEANPACETQTGIADPNGKRIRQIVPNQAPDNIEIYAQILATGLPVRFVTESKALNRWFDVYAFRVGGPETQKIAVVFNNITQRRLAEQALRESEERFRVFVTASSDVVYRMSPDWSEMRQLQGQNFVLNTEGPNSRWMENYLPAEDHPFALAIIEEAIRTKSLYELEHRIKRPDGSLGWVVSRAVPLLDASGEIIEWFGTANDVTERKQAERALRESEVRYRTLFNSIDEGFSVIEMIFDAHEKPIDWRYLEVNPSFVTLTGIHDIVGKRIRELLPDHESYWFEIYGKVALTGESIRFVSEAKGLDGRWFDLYAFRLDGPDSRKVAVLFTNITARKLAEQALDGLNATLEQRVQERTAELSRVNVDLQAVAAAKEQLRESEERLLTVAENLNEGLVIASMEGDFIHWNRASLSMHGFASMAECMGHLADFPQLVEIKTLEGTALPLDQWPMARALRGEWVRNCELRIRRNDTGVERILSYGGSAVRDSVGKQSAFLIVTDITERKQAEVQLRELNDTLERRVLERTQALAELDRRKDEFLAMLSHELRNPLAPLASAVQLLRLQKNEDPLQQQAHSIIERQVGQLKHLVDDLLDVSRITTGSIQLRQEAVSVSTIVERAVETAQPLIVQRRHALQVMLPPQPIGLHADAARLEQVLVNLLTNAAKFTEEGGRIWLDVELEAAAESAVAGAAVVVPMVEIRVRDNGIGIAPELLPRIFDLFTQADRSIDRSQGGLGIGLCLVQRLVELHGGTVRAHSAPGQGSEFVVRLPMMSSSLPVPPLLVAPMALPPGKACRVLVVDDNVDAARSLARLLEMSGHEVYLAYDGPGAVEAALARRPAVVLLDIGLPGLTGLEVAQRIRQEATLAGVVLVALTGYGQESDRQLSWEAGFDLHLVKPADFADIEKILAGICQPAAAAQPT